MDGNDKKNEMNQKVLASIEEIIKTEQQIKQMEETEIGKGQIQSRGSGNSSPEHMNTSYL